MDGAGDDKVASVFTHRILCEGREGYLCVAKGDLHHVYACRKGQLCVHYQFVHVYVFGGEIMWHHTSPLILL